MIAPKPLNRRRPRLLVVRSRRVESLTIAAGFRFSKGVLLCADSQFTAPGSTKQDGSKISIFDFILSEGQSSQLVVAFSGTVDYAKMAISHMVDALRNFNGASWSIVAVRSALEDVLVEFYKKHMYPHPQYSSGYGPSMEFLLGVRDSMAGRVALFKTHETAIVDVPTFGTVGNGSLLADYLIPISYKHPNMSSMDVSALAVHILHQTKRYVDGCGGSSVFLILHDDGTVRSVDYVKVQMGEHFSEFYDHILRNIYLEANDGQTTDETLRESIEALYTMLVAHRDTVRRGAK